MIINIEYKSIDYGQLINIENSPEVFCVFNLDNQILTTTKEWETVTGFGIPDIISQGFHSILCSENDFGIFDTSFKNVLILKEPIQP